VPHRRLTGRQGRATDQKEADMDFRLSPEHEALRASVEQFAQDVVAPQIGDLYEQGLFPYDIVRRMGVMGLFGLPFPEEVAGMGGDYFALCLAIEELARVDSSVAITLEAAVSLGAMPLFRFGSDELKATWLPGLCTGQGLGAFGLTEPGGGSDASATRTTAVLDGDHWVINGSKAFITNSGTDLTTFVIVTAVTGASATGAKEISAILVPSGTPGLTVGPSYSKVGWRSSDTHGLALVDCRVPAANLVGERGRGYAQFLQILDEGRIAIAALATGLATGCLDQARRYAGERETFGQPIGHHQGVAFLVADMAVRAHTSRLAYYDAAARMMAGQPFKLQAAMAKLHSSEAAMDNARYATQVHGGYGFMNEFPVARFYRDAKVLEIGEGTSQIQRMLIARALGL
jgi:short/branched chain acyl-CoA dehydrogenase